MEAVRHKKMIQVFQNQFATKPDRELSWGQLYDYILKHNHIAFVKLRNPTGGIFWEKEKRELKGKLPMFSPNVVFDGQGTKGENIKHLTGSVFVDIDHLSSDDDELTNAKSVFIGIPYVSAVWISPSGTGLHIIANVNANHLKLETFREAWKYVVECLKRDSAIGGKWDEVVHNPERRVYISSDSRLESKEVIQELNIPNAVVSPRRAIHRSGVGEKKTFSTTKEFDRLHSNILIPNDDFIIRLFAENMNPQEAELLRGGDLQSEVGIWYKEPFLVPDLGWYRLGKIQEGNRNAFLANHIAKWMFLNQPYLSEEGMWKYANILHTRVVHSGEYETPYPIYNQIKYFFRNFDPTKTNPNSMKHQHAFFLRKSDLTREDKSLLVRAKMELAWSKAVTESAERMILDAIDSLHLKSDIYPTKAKITIHTLHRYAEDVLKVLGGSKISLKKLYGFCNASEAIKNRIREVNESRPFTEEAARNWAILEDILVLQPERPISEIINDVQVSRKTFYDLKRKDGESARGVQNP